MSQQAIAKQAAADVAATNAALAAKGGVSTLTFTVWVKK